MDWVIGGGQRTERIEGSRRGREIDVFRGVKEYRDTVGCCGIDLADLLKYLLIGV